MRRIAGIALVVLAVFASTAAAKLGPLSANLTMRVNHPTKVTATITATHRNVIGTYTVACGSSHSAGRYTALSGQTHGLRLPASHTGKCVIHFTGQISGSLYGSIHDRINAKQK